ALSARRDPGVVRISHEAHLVLPHHRKNDEGGGFVGTTGRGIGPAYSDKARRIGVRFGDLLDDEVLAQRLARLIEAKPTSTARVLFEGGQGTMLDLAYGTYPYVTSSHPTVGGILVGAGVSHKALTGVYGVVKAFTSRVGHGPFPTEVHDDALAGRLRGSGANQ